LPAYPRCGSLNLNERFEELPPWVKFLHFVFHFFAATQPLHANDDEVKNLVGVWKVTSFKAQLVGDDASPRDLLGSFPKGYLIFTPEGRMVALISASDRKPASTDADSLALMKSVIAHTGKYVVEGDKWITKVTCPGMRF
jgi:hypothetical protein